MNPLDLDQRGRIEKQIVGDLRSAIAAHGPITAANAASAAKRIIGGLKATAADQRETLRPPDAISVGRYRYERITAPRMPNVTVSNPHTAEMMAAHLHAHLRDLPPRKSGPISEEPRG